MTDRSNGGSSTAIMDSIELQPVHTNQEAPIVSSKKPTSIGGRSLGFNTPNSPTSGEEEDRNETLPSPTTATADRIESWNRPRRNIYRVAATFWTFIVMGMNDATYGPLIPYLEIYYGLSYSIVSLVFLSPFAGYNVAALLNNSIHLRFGRRGIALIGPICHIISFVINALHPPFPVLVISYLIVGFGTGVEDAAWNAWIGSMANVNEVMGFLHGCYGIGATTAPLIATTLITKAHVPWYYWYYIMIGCAVLELGISGHAFWSESGQVYRDAHPRTSDASGSRLKEAVLRRPAARTTWLSALFLLGYMGIEVGLGGWIVTFMIRVRHGDRFASGMTATGFWLGLTVGRFVLGFITPRIGEKLAVAVYLPIAMGLNLLFWLVPQFYVGAVAVGLLGFFLGPLFPAAMVACAKLLPKHLHVPSIGFAAALGGSGGAVFPYAIGAIAQSKGVQVLQPIVLALLAMIWILWLCLPKMGKKQE